MDHLNRFPAEIPKPLMFCFNLLNKLNITFFDNAETIFKRNRKLCLSIFLIFLNDISMTVYVRNLFIKDATVSEFADALPVYILCIQAIFKVGIVLHKRNDIENLVNGLGTNRQTSNFTTNQIKKKKRLTKQLKWCQAIYYRINIIATWQHILAPLCVITFRKCLSQEYKLALPFGGTFPYDPSTDWFKYFPTYVFQAYTVIHVAYGYVGSDFLMITLCAIIATEFSILREDLLYVTSSGGDSSTDKSMEELKTNSRNYVPPQILDFIRQHQNLIRLADQLDDIFNRVIFINILFVTIVMCFFGFATTVAHGLVEKANNIAGAVSHLVTTFLFCYYGELLKKESSEIADSAYSSLWNKGDVNYQKKILLIIVRSQRPCCLTLLKHTPVSLNMFTRVLSTTWSYFSLITSVYSEN